jgi:hypothetical protein
MLAQDGGESADEVDGDGDAGWGWSFSALGASPAKPPAPVPARDEAQATSSATDPAASTDATSSARVTPEGATHSRRDERDREGSVCAGAPAATARVAAATAAATVNPGGASEALAGDRAASARVTIPGEDGGSMSPSPGHPATPASSLNEHGVIAADTAAAPSAPDGPLAQHEVTRGDPAKPCKGAIRSGAAAAAGVAPPREPHCAGNARISVRENEEPGATGAASRRDAAAGVQPADNVAASSATRAGFDGSVPGELGRGVDQATTPAAAHSSDGVPAPAAGGSAGAAQQAQLSLSIPSLPGPLVLTISAGAQHSEGTIAPAVTPSQHALHKAAAAGDAQRAAPALERSSSLMATRDSPSGADGDASHTGGSGQPGHDAAVAAEAPGEPGGSTPPCVGAGTRSEAASSANAERSATETPGPGAPWLVDGLELSSAGSSAPPNAIPRSPGAAADTPPRPAPPEMVQNPVWTGEGCTECGRLRDVLAAREAQMRRMPRGSPRPRPPWLLSRHAALSPQVACRVHGNLASVPQAAPGAFCH